jgi:hypothetical protein
MMFRLNELQMTSFKKLINSQHTVKMYKFLKFFLNQDNLKGWIMDEWLKLYDKDYIQRHVMDSLTNWILAIPSGHHQDNWLDYGGDRIRG